jgi:thymidylate kinase
MEKKKIRFISFDGQDGVGKSSALQHLYMNLEQKNIKVHKTSLLGGDKTCDFQLACRKVLLHDKFPSDSVELEENLFALTDLEGYKMAETFLTETSNSVVLKDRNLASHVCYALSKGMTLNQVTNCHRKIIHKEKILNQNFGTLNLILIADNVKWPLERIKKRAKDFGEPIVERLENQENQERVMEFFKNVKNYNIFEGLNFEIIEIAEEDTIQVVQAKVQNALEKYEIVGLNAPFENAEV